MKARASSASSGARRTARRGRRVDTLTRSPLPAGPLTPSVPPFQIAFAPELPFEPSPPATNLAELIEATIRRVTCRFTERSIATFQDGAPCLPEMQKAARWSGWGAWFCECMRAPSVSSTEKFEGEILVKAAFERRRRIIGYPKTRYLSKDETLTALGEALSYAQRCGRS